MHAIDYALEGRLKSNSIAPSFSLVVYCLEVGIRGVYWILSIKFGWKHIQSELHSELLHVAYGFIQIML
jgi:hypothetical protein